MNSDNTNFDKKCDVLTIVDAPHTRPFFEMKTDSALELVRSPQQKKVSRARKMTEPTNSLKKLVQLYTYVKLALKMLMQHTL